MLYISLSIGLFFTGVVLVITSLVCETENLKQNIVNSLISSGTNLAASAIALFIYFYGAYVSQIQADETQTRLVHLSAVTEMRRVAVENAGISKLGSQMAPLLTACRDLHPSGLLSDLQKQWSASRIAFATASAYKPTSDFFIESSRQDLQSLNPYTYVTMMALENKSQHSRAIASRADEKFKQLDILLTSAGFFSDQSVRVEQIKNIYTEDCESLNTLASSIIVSQILSSPRMMLICSFAYFSQDGKEAEKLEFARLFATSSDNTPAETVFDVVRANTDFFASVTAEGTARSCANFSELGETYKVYEPMRLSGVRF